MSIPELIDQYIAGPSLLREAVDGLTDRQLDLTPIPGRWSTRQVICHIADFEPIYADRIKRVIAEENPTFFGGDPDVFATHLAYSYRQVSDELKLIEAVRQQVATILGTLSAADFQRIGTHSEDGKMSLKTLLQNITNHIPHHVQYIREKRQAMGF